MISRRYALLALGAWVLAAAPLAAAPWQKMGVFKQLDADPNAMYPIDVNNGPWLIMAATFSGEGAEDQARRLIHELRQQHKLTAYSYQKKFEFSKTVEGKGLNPHGEPPKMRYKRDNDFVEIAVMVGDYQSVDDPEAQKALKKLKYIEPKSLAIEPGKSTSQSLAALRTIQKHLKQAVLPADSDELKRGPMAGAFVVTNPYLPSEYFVPKGIDKFVVEMNAGVTHSLLDCPEKYTVKVATFTGHAIILDEKNQAAIERGETPKSYLEDAAKNAHLLTEALRKMGYEAYEFHDRSSSIVTVGSFGTVGSRRDDGEIEINPALHKVMLNFGAETKVEPGKPPQIGKAKKLGGIPFDVQPVPVEVPRRSISRDYARDAATALR